MDTWRRLRPNPQGMQWSIGLAAVLFLEPLSSSAADVAFARHVLNADCDFSAAAVIDVNHDGQKDVVCGNTWYESPTWERHFVRDVERIRGRPDGFSHLPLDVNGDGWTDIVTVNYRSSSIKWIEHPGAGLGPWVAHTVEEPGPMESGRLYDIDNDGQLDLLPNGVQFAAWWELDRRSSGGQPTLQWVRHELPSEVAAHGVGFGDVDGDGRGDIVGPLGWLKAPENPREGRWLWKPEFNLGRASIPILVVDVDEDGDNDLVWARAHGFGLYWLEQTSTEDNDRRWIHHTIDTSWSQCHAPCWADLDGDGQNELIGGKRYLAHEGRDPGAYDPIVAYRYQFDQTSRTWHRWLISAGEGVGFGLDPKVEDVDDDGDLDLVVSGRSGLYYLENLGESKLERPHPSPPTYGNQSQLLVVKDNKGTEKKVESRFDWGLRRAHILEALEQSLGPLPGTERRVSLNTLISQEMPADDYLHQKVTFQVDVGHRVAADLLIPNTILAAAPAVLCAQGSPNGDASPSRLLGDAEQLARRGYVCIVPDVGSMDESTSGQPAPAPNQRPRIMETVWVHIRALDLLESMPTVDAERIGCLGDGRGAEVALVTAALDQRIVATSLRGDLMAPQRGPALPAPDKEGASASTAPYELAELLAALAPRAVYLQAQIGASRSDVVEAAAKRASPVYELTRADGMLKSDEPIASTRTLDESRHQVMEWFDSLLRRRRAF